MNQSRKATPSNLNEQKLISAIKDLTSRLKQEQVKVFKNDITIKMLISEIAKLKGQLIKPRQSSFDLTNLLREVNNGLQHRLNLSDDDVKKHTDEWMKKIEDIKPYIDHERRTH